MIKKIYTKFKKKLSPDFYKINGLKFDRFIIDGLKKVGFKIDKNNLVVDSSDGLKLRIDFQPYVLFESYTCADYDFVMSEKDAILIDIGMNAGFVSLKFAKKNNIKKVYSYEPFIPTYQGAMKNIELNPDISNKIETFPFGLSNENKKLNLLYEKGLAGNMSIVKNLYNENSKIFKQKNAHLESVEIKDSAEVLTPILERHKDKKIILKCDTEGSEFEIIESLSNANLLMMFDIILMEYHFKSPKIIEETLAKNNFVIFRKGENPNVKCGTLIAVKN